MYNNVYQEYINNMLGTTTNMQPDYDYNSQGSMNYFQNHSITNMDLEKFYPDLYKVLYPMIKAACMKNTNPITEETIDEMVKDIYSNFNADNNVENETQASSSSSSKAALKMTSETRNIANARNNNFVLNDLIRILLIRELLGRPGNFPPFRPGFPGPGVGRPPFRPRFEEQNYDIYEHLNF